MKRSIRVVLTAATALTLVGAGLPLVAQADSSPPSCWENISDDNSTQSLCVQGTEADLKDAVYERYGLVIVDNPSAQSTEIAAEKARAKRLHLQVGSAGRTRAVAAADPTPAPTGTAGSDAPQVSPTDSTYKEPVSTSDATYVLGKVFRDPNYKGLNKLYTTTKSGTCKKYYFKFTDWNDYDWPGGGIFDWYNDSISSFEPGPYCKLGFWVDAKYKGSFYGNYGTKKGDMEWMDNQASSLWFTG